MTIAEPLKRDKPTRKQKKLNSSLLLKDIIGNRYSLGILRFFVVHPHGRFRKLAIIHAVDENGNRLEVENALATLVKKGVIITSIGNSIPYYLLTRDEPTRHLIFNLAEFDWSQWQKLDHYYVADRRRSVRI